MATAYPRSFLDSEKMYRASPYDKELFLPNVFLGEMRLEKTRLVGYTTSTIINEAPRYEKYPLL